MRRIVIVLSCLATSLSIVSGAVVADSKSGSMMKSKPGSMDWLLGTWTCTSKMNAMAKSPAHTETDTLTFQPAMNGWMMQTYKGKGYSAQSFWRWDKGSNQLVSVGVDSFGGYGIETSRGMHGSNTMTMSGTMYYGGHPSGAQDMVTKISDTQMRHVGRYQMNGTWHQSDDTSCTKNG